MIMLRNISRERLAFLALMTIVIGACTLSLRWVFLVPIFQSPDEDVHFDYALCLSELGGLIRATSAQPGEVPGWLVHPFSVHLANETNKHTIAFHPELHMPPDYGSRDYYKAINRTAPKGYDLRNMPRAPAVAAIYPYGYYAVLAAWLKVIRLAVHDRAVNLFFAARIFSVLLLACNLFLNYALARELGLRRHVALLLIAGIGFFPLTSFVSSYVQPDNLAWTLVSLCFYLALFVRRKPDNWIIQAFLGLALGYLLVTKLQFFVCVSLPIAAMLAVEIYRPDPKCLLRYAATSVLLLTPSLVLESAHLWVVSGTRSCYTGHAPYTNFNQFVLGGFTNAVWDYFVCNTHLSFWGIFGWMDTPLQIRNPVWTERVRFILQVCAWLLLGLTLARGEQVVSRLVRVAYRGRWRSALRMALSNVPINSYFLFTIFMLVLYIYYQNRFGAQGRNWIPYLLPIFWTSIMYAPKALTLRTPRLICSWTVIIGLLLFCAVGGHYSIKTLKRRYYADNFTAAPLCVKTVSYHLHQPEA